MLQLSVIFALISLSYGHAGCPIGWFQYKEKCYFVQNDVVTNTEYLEFCSSLNATPLAIHSPEEEEFIKTITKPSSYYWLGAYRVKLGLNKFEYKDGSEFKYQHWASTEPDSLNYAGYECLVIYWGTASFFWYDHKCTTPSNQICQKPVDFTNVTSSNVSSEFSKYDCPFGWFQYGEKCFYVNDVPATNVELVKFCSHFDAVPISIHSPEEEQFLRKITKEGWFYWLGAYRVGKGKKKFIWKDGTEVHYDRWAIGEPNSLDSEHYNCTIFISNKHFLWYDDYCYRANTLQLCQKHISESVQSAHIVSPDDPKCGCPIGWYKHGESCFYVRNEKANWNQSIDFCAYFNSSLISIHTIDQEHFLKKITKYASYYWLGGYRVEKGKKKFAWLDKSEYKYERWAPNEPDSINHLNYHCVSAYADDRFYWYDYYCNTPEFHLCQKTSANDQCGCPSGWFQYGSKCFFINNDKATNNEYVEYCKEINAEPASIHTPEEEEFLKKITKPGNYYWIGAYRIGKGNKTFEWKDGTEYRYEHWATGQPDSLNSLNDYCVSVWSDPKFLWYDENCNLPKFQICQRYLNVSDKPFKKRVPKPISADTEAMFSQMEQGLNTTEDSINDVFYIIVSIAKAFVEIIREHTTNANSDKNSAKGKLSERDTRFLKILGGIVDGTMFDGSSAEVSKDNQKTRRKRSAQEPNSTTSENQNSVSSEFGAKFSQIQQRIETLKSNINYTIYALTTIAMAIEKAIRENANMATNGKLSDRDDRFVKLLSRIVDGSMFGVAADNSNDVQNSNKA